MAVMSGWIPGRSGPQVPQEIADDLKPLLLDIECYGWERYVKNIGDVELWRRIQRLKRVVGL